MAYCTLGKEQTIRLKPWIKKQLDTPPHTHTPSISPHLQPQCDTSLGSQASPLAVKFPTEHGAVVPFFFQEVGLDTHCPFCTGTSWQTRTSWVLPSCGFIPPRSSLWVWGFSFALGWLHSTTRLESLSYVLHRRWFIFAILLTHSLLGLLPWAILGALLKEQQ